MSKLQILDHSVHAADRQYLSMPDPVAPIPPSGDGTAVSAGRRFLRACRRQVAVWRANRIARRGLGELDDRSLRDIGLSPETARFEASRPFWRKLRDLRA